MISEINPCDPSRRKSVTCQIFLNEPRVPAEKPRNEDSIHGVKNHRATAHWSSSTRLRSRSSCSAALAAQAFSSMRSVSRAFLPQVTRSSSSRAYLCIVGPLGGGALRSYHRLLGTENMPLISASPALCFCVNRAITSHRTARYLAAPMRVKRDFFYFETTEFHTSVLKICFPRAPLTHLLFGSPSRKVKASETKPGLVPRNFVRGNLRQVCLETLFNGGARV